jgi:sugar-specific transcriptional regulator TrmB
MERILQKLNLSDNEITLYLWLLRNGENTAAEAARNISMDKSSAYRAAENLFQNGLLIKTEKQRGTIFAAQNPETLKSLFNSKKNELNAIEGSLDDLITNLKQQSSNSRNTLIHVEKGYDAHIRLMELSLNDNPEKIIREFWNLDNPIFRFHKYSRYIETFVKRRLELKIQDQYLARYTPNKPWSKQMNPDSKTLKEIRLIPKEFENNNGFRIFGEYAEIVSFSDIESNNENDDFLVITIQDKIIVKLLKDIFNFIWSRSELYTTADYKKGELTFKQTHNG